MAYSTPRLIVPVLLTFLAGTSIHPVGAQQNEVRVAVVIGNAAYPDAEASLKDPVNNARSLADELRRHGFEVDSSENLTKEAMRAALDRFYGKIKSGSTALLFFSGYGIQSDRQTYMIPINAQIWTEPDVRRDGYSLDSVLAEMNSRGARVKIAILDASRRNPFERRFRAVAGGLAPVSVPKGTVVMYAAAPGAVARDGDRQVFVSELIKEIRGPGRIEEAFNRTLISVSKASQGEQVPWFSSSLVDEFSFVTSARTPPAPAPSVIEAEKKPAAPQLVPEADARAHHDGCQGPRRAPRHLEHDADRGHPGGLGGGPILTIVVAQAEPLHTLHERLGTPARLAPEHRAAQEIRDPLARRIDGPVLVEIVEEGDALGLGDLDRGEAGALRIVASLTQLGGHALEADAGALNCLGAGLARRVRPLPREEEAQRPGDDKSSHRHRHQHLEEREPARHAASVGPMPAPVNVST